MLQPQLLKLQANLDGENSMPLFDFVRDSKIGVDPLAYPRQTSDAQPLLQQESTASFSTGKPAASASISASSAPAVIRTPTDANNLSNSTSNTSTNSTLQNAAVNGGANDAENAETSDRMGLLIYYDNPLARLADASTRIPLLEIARKKWVAGRPDVTFDKNGYACGPSASYNENLQEIDNEIRSLTSLIHDLRWQLSCK